MRPDPEHASARDVTGQVCRCGVVDHVATVVGVGHSQCDPKPGVGADGIGDHSGWSLGRQDEVDPEAPAPLCHVDHAIDEGRDLPCQGGELVDHDDQRGWTVDGRHGLDIRRVGEASLDQEVLAPSQLGPQRHQCALRQRLGEVRDHADGVGKLRHTAERSSSLVVDQQERDPLRRVVGGQCRDHGPQELALPRARRAGDEGVRAIPAEVDAQHAAARNADRGGQVARRAGRPPPTRDRGRGAVPGQSGVEDLGQGEAAGQRRVGGSADRNGGPKGRQRPRRRFSLVGGHVLGLEVGPAAVADPESADG